jgi:drug/metabolite transporter (DMT)-like permease
MPSRRHTGVLVALVIVQLIFAVHYLAAKVLLDEIPARAWAVMRILPAAGILLAFALRKGIPRLEWRDIGALAVQALFGVVLNQILFVEGLARTTPAHSALINTTIPIATLSFACALGREALRPARVLGIACALAGVLVLLRVDHLELSAEWFHGDLLSLLNALSFGLFLVLSKPTATKLGPIVAVGGTLAFGSLGIALAGAGSLAQVDHAQVPPKIWWIAAFIVAGPTIATYFLNAWALTRIDSSQVAVFVYLQPVIAAALSAAFLGEAITPRLYASAALIFAGLFLATNAATQVRRAAINGARRAR